jgi:hypothetical protein
MLKEKIPIKIIFNSNKEKFFKIRGENDKTKSFFTNIFKNDSKSDTSIKCSTINEFCSKFPDITIMLENINSTDDEMNIGSYLYNYLNTIKEFIDSKFIEKEKFNVFKKIEKHIFEAIYDKLFSKEPSKSDVFFYLQTTSLSWIEEKHLNLNVPNLSKYISLGIKYIKKLDNEHWPQGKYKTIEKLFDIIQSKIFNNKINNSNLKHIAKIFDFLLIKSKPVRLPSNLKYIKLLLTNSSDNANFDRYYNILQNCIKNINNLNYKNLKGVTEKEFKENCKNEKNKNYRKNMNSFLFN